jgi:hypothetical protein
LNDGDVHKSHPVIATNATDRGRAYAISDGNPNCGHYDMHYFHNCDILDGKPLQYLLMHWSCRLKIDPPTAAGDPTNTDLNNHRHPGFRHANERLNRKNYLIERKSGTHDIYVRPFWFMEVKNDSNGGAHIAMATVVNGGSWMNLTAAHFRKAAYRPEPNRFATNDPNNSVADFDGNTNEPLANSHEMGHALANADEYLYDAEDLAGNNWDGLPAYRQFNTAEGGPYNFDALGLMSTNRAWRLRNIWKYVCWLHDDSATGRDLAGFFTNTRFQVRLPGSSGDLIYDVKEAYRNIFLAAKRGTDISTGSNSKVDLFLYKLDDETARLTRPGVVLTGILVVRTKFALRFDDVGANVWQPADKLTWGQALNNDYQAMTNRQFRLSCPPTNDFQETLCVFNPHFKEYSGGAPGDSHINVRVRAQTGGGFSASGNVLTVDRDVDTARIIRYCFGLATGTGNLVRTNFPNIVTWIGGASIANATFTMNNF